MMLSDDDGDQILDPKWHYVDDVTSDPSALCTGEYFGLGASAVVYETKEVKRGGITCEQCLARIKKFKNVKL